MKKILIAGAGAAGLMAAICCARYGAQVLVIEKAESAGKKLSMTGNGRCNLGHIGVTANDYNESARPRMTKWLDAFGPADVIAFFDSIGVPVRDEEDYLYPYSGQATTLQRALVAEALSLGVELRYNVQAKELLRQEDTLYMRTTDGLLQADAYILATGGIAGPKTTGSTGDGYYMVRSLGAQTTAPLPALVPLRSSVLDLKGERGLRSYGQIGLYIDQQLVQTEEGELQLTQGSISGIPVLQVSGRASRALTSGQRVELALNFYPDLPGGRAQLEAYLAPAESDKRVGDILGGTQNALLVQLLLDQLGIDPRTPIGEMDVRDRARICDMCMDMRIPIEATGDVQKAQVTSGGIRLEDLTDTLSLKTSENVYVIGELADVDGRCGGYNLQWAWTSAQIASRSACQ